MTRLRYTIRPKHGSVIEFLLRYATDVQSVRPNTNKTADCTYVGCVKRRYGPEAIICVDYLTVIEINACTEGPIRWFLIPNQHLREYLKGQVIK